MRQPNIDNVDCITHTEALFKKKSFTWMINTTGRYEDWLTIRWIIQTQHTVVGESDRLARVPFISGTSDMTTESSGKTACLEGVHYAELWRRSSPQGDTELRDSTVRFRDGLLSKFYRQRRVLNCILSLPIPYSALRDGGFEVGNQCPSERRICERRVRERKNLWETRLAAKRQNNKKKKN